MIDDSNLSIYDVVKVQVENVKRFRHFLAIGEDISSHYVSPVIGSAMETEFTIGFNLINPIFYQSGWNFHVEIYEKKKNNLREYIMFEHHKMEIKKKFGDVKEDLNMIAEFYAERKSITIYG